MIIILLGISGSGKGTQAMLLKEKLGLEHFNMGGALRARKEKGDFTAKRIAKEMDAGILLLAPILNDLWMDAFEEFKAEDNFKGLIIDGSPRRVFEAELLGLTLEWYEWDKDVRPIFIDLSEQEAVDRLTKRRICIKCKKNIPYVGEYKTMEQCDECGGELVKRDDDDPEDIKERFRWYREDVLPTVEYYRKKGNLIEINGDQSIEDVHKEIMEKLK